MKLLWPMGSASVLATALWVTAPQDETKLPAAWAHWRYSAAVHVPSLEAPRLVQVLIPEAVAREAEPHGSDLRVMDDSGREVPFVLHARTERRSREARAARLTDLTHRPGQDTRAVVDLGAQPLRHNQMEVETPLEDFFARVAIDVSEDGTDWRIVQEAAPIYRFTKQNLDGNQKVRYTDNTSRYLRLRVQDGPDRFPLTGVRVWREVHQEAERVPAQTVLRPDPGAPAGESWWTGEAAGQAVSQVRFAVEQAVFHRPVRIRTSEDGATWRTVGSGEMYRMRTRESGAARGGLREQLRVAFPETRAPFLRVEVVNRSDAPLAGATPSLYTIPRRVVLKAEPGRRYRLLYGNARAQAPDYELERVTPEPALEAADAVELGPGVANAAYVDPAPWSERHPAVLWGALVAALAVLGWLAIRALKGSAGASAGSAT